MTKLPAKRPADTTRAIQTTDDEIAAMLATLTEPQRAKVEVLLAQTRGRAFGPPMTLSFKGEVLEVGYDHKSAIAATALTMADLGTIDPAFSSGIIKQVAAIGSHKQRADEGNSNFLLSVVRAVQPRDGLETMLAVQMGAIHAATMMMARRLNLVENIPQQDAAERALNKLARTYAVQMDALRTYRTGGKQSMIIKHVNVSHGGKAIVGNLKDGGLR